MSSTRRRIAASLLVLSTAPVLAACGDGSSTTPSATVITHKEYIPATLRSVESCSGAVPVMCGEEKVLEKQCWRLDIETRYTLSADRAEKARQKGKPDYRAVPSFRCVFPSEFKAAKVGDAFVEPKVAY